MSTYDSDLDLAARTSLHALPRSGVFEFELHRGWLLAQLWGKVLGKFWEGFVEGLGGQWREGLEGEGSGDAAEGEIYEE